MGTVTLRVPQERASFPTCWCPAKSSSPSSPSRSSSSPPLAPSIARETGSWDTALAELAVWLCKQRWIILQCVEPPKSEKQVVTSLEGRGKGREAASQGQISCRARTRIPCSTRPQDGLSACLTASLAEWDFLSWVVTMPEAGILPGFGSKDKICLVCAASSLCFFCSSISDYGWVTSKVVAISHLCPAV